MESNETPEVEAGPAPRRGLSGMLIMSIFLSLSGFVIIPVIGGIGGLIFALMGRKRVKANPLLIGPTFALFCVVAAGVSLPLQLWAAYEKAPQLGYHYSVSDLHTGFFVNLETRNWQGIYDSMHVDYRDTHQAEDVVAALAPLFPGEDEIKLTPEILKYDDIEGDELEDLSRRFKAFMDGGPENLDYDLSCSILFPADQEQVDLRLHIRVHRSGYVNFQHSVVDFEAERVPLEEEEPATPEEPGEDKGEGSGDDPEDDND